MFSVVQLRFFLYVLSLFSLSLSPRKVFIVCRRYQFDFVINLMLIAMMTIMIVGNVRDWIFLSVIPIWIDTIGP